MCEECNNSFSVLFQSSEIDEEGYDDEMRTHYPLNKFVHDIVPCQDDDSSHRNPKPPTGHAEPHEKLQLHCKFSPE
jgi:hypothetical protein